MTQEPQEQPAPTKSQSISIRGQTMARLKTYCEQAGGTPSKVVQGFLEEYEPFGEKVPAPLERDKTGNRFRDTIPAEPEPAVEATPEPEVEVEATPEPEPAPEPKIEVAPEPAPEPKIKVAPEPEPAPEPKIEAAPEPKPKPKSRPEPRFRSELRQPVKPHPVERIEKTTKPKGSDVVEPNDEGLVPYAKKSVHSGGVHEF